MKNLNLLYNKIYYDGLPSVADVVRHNQTLLDARFDPQTDYRKPFDGVQIFCLETVYPGMILGSGNPHGAHASEDDLQMGFSFDYVTGQPYIPGSSVKGGLRSCFEQYPDVIRELTDYMDVTALISEFFEGDDVFLDAVVCKGNRQGKLMGEDYITPHPDPVKDPTPIHIIKILPEVQFEFRFVLKDGPSISAKAKLMLYQKLLELFGVGAKTNVGYGGLVACDRVTSATGHAATHAANAGTNGGFASDERTQVKCGYCNTMNYKYRKLKNGQITTQINENWTLHKCRACGKRFQ